MKNPWILILLCTLLATLAVASKDEPRPKAKASVRVGIKENLKEILKFPVLMQNAIQMKILSEYFATVLQTFKQIGDQVAKGEVVMTIRREENIADFKPITLTSPMDGLVQKTEVLPGEPVNQGQVLMHVVDPSKISLEIEVPQKYLTHIKSTSTAELQLDVGLPEGEPLKVPLKVIGIAPLGDLITGTSTVKLDWNLEGEKAISALIKQYQLRAGMSGRVLFQVNPRKGIAVPESSITYEGKKPVLRLLAEGDKILKTEVTLGRSLEGHQVEVLSPDLEGKRIVTQINRLTKEGEEVEVDGP